MMPKKILLLVLLFLLALPAGYMVGSWIFPGVLPGTTAKKTTTWTVESIDTMKYSRDLTAEKIHDPAFDKIIDEQVHAIAQTGATHVAIATPYDQEFVPMLARWVAAARKYNLKIWFRGNFSGWENWFDHASITRDEHLVLLRAFIKNNANLFADGDIFTPCPECENGGPGDPRQNGDVEGHRLFLIAEYQASQREFLAVHKKVSVGYDSMNYDVALKVMDAKTTQALGGVVTIDHYVSSPDKLVSTIQTLASASGGKIFLGEFGVPIPDIHGNMTDKEQAAWIEEALTKLAKEPEVIGVNYWVGFGGSTKLWNDDGSPRTAVGVLTSFFTKK